ncbi:hypothetical protein BJAS_P4493 [Bathymodiolus japonicus methanotrophic gill symbiont]|nr:hypothetical protein BJAS_P4493 [Bathymodiolus japonicus methanotrophic gill symbiont]
MKANSEYLQMPRHFWAYVRTISQGCGYTDRKTKKVKIPTIESIIKAFDDLGLDISEILHNGHLTDFGTQLLGYFEYRANVLNDYVKPRLMNKDQAQQVFEELYSELSPNCPLPMNKQKGEKKANAFFTCIINILIEHEINGRICDYDPRKLTTVTNGGCPLRTLARRVDGAYPSVVNPTAIWEIKEYYYTTTFGSRVADGVYETLLDGMELSELHEHEGIKVHHYLMIDDYFTWWECGRSYLCRIIDMLHMGYADEVLFGYEVVERIPKIVNEWL